MVRIHACHAWGRGFEPRPHRKKVVRNDYLFLFMSRPYFPNIPQTVAFPRRWRTLPPLYLTPSYISCATLLESVRRNNLARNGNKTSISFPLRAQKEEKTSFLARSGNKTAISFPLRTVECVYLRSGHSPGTLTLVLGPSKGGLCSR